MQPGDLPVVVWGRPEAHLCLGQHQSAALELTPDCGVPVVRRPLGGGGVWLDSNQACVVLIAPLDSLPRRNTDWYVYALAPILQVYREAGMPVTLEAQDIWLHGRKLAGSGAATIGQAGLVGSSFLLRFPLEQFASRIATPSSDFQQWLVEALRTAITSWSEHTPLPDWAWLSMVYRRAANQAFGWRWHQSLLTEGERAARDGWRDELIPEHDSTTRLVPHGIKINASSFLTERHYDDGWVRVLTQGRRIVRVALSAATALPETCLRDVEPGVDSLGQSLLPYFNPAQASEWTLRILETAHFYTEST
jgi:lipoate-protein ligase A